jgi:hypothetical protein
MNLDGVVDFNPAWMFTDAFLGSRDWISHAYNTNTRQQTWDGGGTINVSAQGWPTHLNQFTDANGQPIQQRLGTLMLDGRGVAGHYPAGTYRAEWTGTATLAWGADASVAQQGDLPGGRHFALLNVNPTQAGIYMRIDAMSDADPIRDLHLWMPDYNGQSFAGQAWRPGAAFSPFHPLFRERLDPFDTIRFMQPQDTNTTDIVHWSDRKPVDFARQATFSMNFQNGLAPEYMIELANELHSNAWFCMPHTAEDDFVRGFAQLTHDTLDPQQKAYVEFSNELWNGAPGFEGNRWLQQQQSLPQNAGLSGLDIWAREAKRDFDIWSSVFADQPSRLVRVVAGQSANSWIAGQLLQRMGGAFDAVSCDGYVGFGPWNSQQFNASTTVDDVVAATFAQSLPNTLNFLRNHEAMAQQYSAQLGRPIQTIVYEGGPLFMGSGQPFEQAFLAASRDPRMYDVYSQLLRGANDIGVDQFDAYVFTDTSSQGDASHLRWMDQPLTDAHKYRALLDAMPTSPPPGPPPPPPPPVNANPVARDDALAAPEDAAVIVSVLGNDTDADGDPLIVTSVGTSLHGIAALNSSGTITYTPSPDYNGSDSFTYSISDGRGGTATASVNVTVTAVNDAPTVAQPANASAATIIGRSVTLTALGADVDASGEPGLTYTWVRISGPTGATFSTNAGNAAKSTIASFTQPGVYAFGVTIAAPSGASVAGGTVSVTVVRTLTSVRVTPATASVPVRGTTQFSARAYDQWDSALSTQSGFVWSMASGGGGVSSTGLFTAPTTTGTSVVRARASGSTIAGTATITVTVARPTAPSNLVYSRLTNRRVRLTWRDNSGTEQGFRVQTSTNGTTWTTLATLGPAAGTGSSLSYTSGSFAAGRRDFRVVAYNAGGTSNSNTVTVTL